MGGSCILQSCNQESRHRFCQGLYCLRFGVLESIITDNAANHNSDLIKSICEAFKIKHKNPTTYRPQINGAIEAVYKNIKKIIRKMVENHKQWHKKLPFAMFEYRTMVHMIHEMAFH